MLEIRSFRDIVRLMFIYQRELRWAIVTTIVVAVLAAFLLPPRYDSDARLLIKPGSAGTLLPISASGRGVMLSPVPQRDVVVNDEKILTGQQIVREVAQRFLAERAAEKPPRSLWKRAKVQLGRIKRAAIGAARDVLVFVGLVDHSTKVERLSRTLIKHFSVRHVPDSSIMAVRFQWSDPVVAQRVLRNWVNIYLGYRQRVLSDPTNLYEFYKAQAHTENLLIAQYRARLNTLERRAQGVNIRQRLADLTKRVDATEVERAADVNKLAALKEGIVRDESLIPKTSRLVPKEQKVGLNPVLLDLKTRMNGLEIKRINMLRTYTPQAPPVMALDKAIAILATRLQKTRKQISLAKTIGTNSVFVSLQQGLVTRKIHVQELEASIAEKNRQIHSLMAVRDKVRAIEPRAGALERLLHDAEHNDALYLSNAEQARIANALAVNRISNIAIVESATLNPARVFPKSLDILFAALPLSILVGLVVVSLYHLLDQRIHDGGLMERTFNVPLWASIPERGGQGQEAVFTASLTRLLALLPTEQVGDAGRTVALTSAGHGEGVTFLTGQIERLLTERGGTVAKNPSGGRKPGQITLVDCSAVLHDEGAVARLAGADVILLVVEAGSTTTSSVREALRVLGMTFKQVDGVILNRRHFEIPVHVMRWLDRWHQMPTG
ncbi:MAG: GumC family protein [Acidiferrobacteraceae bacterium]